MADNKDVAVKTHQPCPCGKSSDAYSEYADGHGFCFSCGKPFKGPETMEEAEEGIFTYEILPWRGITRDTMSKYEVRTAIDSEGKPVRIGFPYERAVKVRYLEEKKFRAVGDMRNDTTLFGMGKFSAGSSKSITITEGEMDALSVHQILGYPAVSVKSATSAHKDCASNWKYLNSFERIYLCFDNDQPGQEAAAKVAALFDFNKVYHVQLTKYKDANEYLVEGDADEFKRIWWNSRRFVPEGVISSYSEYDAILDQDQNKEGTPYPFPALTEATYGLRPGEVVLFTALEGRGKTEILRAIEYHLLKTTDDNIAVIHLEEGKGRALKGLAGYELGVPVHLPDSYVTNEQVKEAIRSITKRDDRLHMYSHFGSDDPDVILDVIRFLVTACGCKFVTLDHITMVVSGLHTEDERKALDYLSTRLGMMVEELDFSLLLVSHVNDDNKTRGSRNISKIAAVWLHLDRDINADNKIERNTTHIYCNKNRFGAVTGHILDVYFDLDTFMVTDKIPVNLPPVEM
jgi:twinkle protein